MGKDLNKSRVLRCGKPVKIVYKAFPQQLQGKVRGLTSARPDCYLVIIDNSRPAEDQRQTLGHELAHIYLNHIDSSRPTKELEREANERAGEFYSLLREGLLPEVYKA